MVRSARMAMFVLSIIARDVTAADAPPKPAGSPPTRAGTSAAPAPTPAGPIGTISGTIKDKRTGQPVIEAGVEVVGTKKTVRTNLDGTFSVKVPPGTYELRVFAPAFGGLRIPNVVVEEGATTTTNTELVASKQSVMIVEVVAKAPKRSDQAQLVKRKEQAVIADAVSAEAIAKSSDSDAAEVVQRAPSIAVRDDKYFFVRGLNERYSAALLNGNRLSSTDPAKRMVPLDLFPSSFLEGLEIQKTFTPDQPGDFGGGLALIDLKEFPEKPHYGFGLSTGYNTDTTFKKFSTYSRDGGADYFGFGKNSRELPGLFGDEAVSIANVNDQRRFTSSLNNIWNRSHVRAAPDTGLDLSAGNSWGPFGFEFGGIYNTSYSRKARALIRNVTFGGSAAEGFDPTDIVQTEILRGDEHTFKTRLAGLLTGAFKPNPDHKISLATFLNRSSADTVISNAGTSNRRSGAQLRAYALEYKEEELAFGQLRGEHKLPWFEVAWRSAFTRTTQDIPDRKIVTYSQSAPGVPFVVDDLFGGGTRTFSTLVEHLSDSALDFTVPFPIWSELTAKLKFGSAYTYRSRDHNLRIFQHDSIAAGDITAGPEVRYDPRRAGIFYNFTEITQPRDAFEATHEILGNFGMLDVPIIRDRLRFVGGVRYEYSLIRAATVNDVGDPRLVRKRTQDWLPSATLLVSPRDDMKIAAAWSRTVTRPEFRELTPVLFPAGAEAEPVVGNPDLTQIKIENYDLRWDWNLSPTELLSVSLFYKTLEKPIERSFLAFASFNAVTFRNATDAEIMGVELESRKHFGFLHPALQHLMLVTNFSYLESTVTPAPPTRGIVETQSGKRALQGQSPFIANGALEYAHPDWGSLRLAYNTAGRNIDIVGVQPLPPEYFERRNQLDFSLVANLNKIGMPGKLKFTAENLLNDPVLRTQADLSSNKYVKGIRLSLGVSFDF